MLAAIDPRHAYAFLTEHALVSLAAFVVLGAVLLAFTGTESLYADMGHFGKWPIRAGWFALVLPALLLNYFGQGALLIANPAALDNPFYHAFPGWALYPMVALATAAAVIASQASITGVASLMRQAVQLGFLPRLNIVQTSARAYGQVYIPALNWFLLVMVLAAVLGFGSSSAPGAGLRRGAHRHHAGHHHPHLLRDPLRLALPAVAVPVRHRLLLPHRRRLLRLGDAQGAARRLVPARDRRSACSW